MTPNQIVVGSLDALGNQGPASDYVQMFLTWVQQPMTVLMLLFGFTAFTFYYLGKLRSLTKNTGNGKKPETQAEKDAARLKSIKAGLAAKVVAFLLKQEKRNKHNPETGLTTKEVNELLHQLQMSLGVPQLLKLLMDRRNPKVDVPPAPKAPAPSSEDKVASLEAVKAAHAARRKAGQAAA